MWNIFFAIFSGILAALSFDFPFLSFIAWFSLTPFLYAINKSTTKRLFIVGIVFGLSFYGVSIFWVANVTKLGLVFLLFYLSLYPALFALFGKYFSKKPLRIITLPCIWVILEFLKESIWCGFGWANLGYSQYNNLYLIQVADLWGVKLISFLVVMVNVLLYEVVFIKKFNLRKISFVFLVILCCFFYSTYKLKTLKATDSIEVSIVQPNVAQELKWDISAQPSIIDKLKSLGLTTKKDSLVIFPEAAWPHTLNESNFDQLEEFVKDIKREVLIGAVVKEGNKFYNVALLLNQDGRFLDVYRKIKLVPFGEYIPLRRYLSFIKVINAIGDMSRGQDYHLFSYKGRDFGILICFEDIFPLFVSRLARDSSFLINITNDAWFGGEPEASQHLGIMTMRAIENRISIVRAANTGISGWVSFKGEVATLKDENNERVFLAGVDNFYITLNKRGSFYNRYGEISFIIFCIIFLLGVSARNE